MNTELMFSSQTKNWSTPQYLFDELNKEFEFTLDACADTSNYKVRKYFNEKSDGLSQSWMHNRTWCNPPYGREMGEWIKKAYETMLLTSNANDIIVMLLPARTDTRWFHEYIYTNPNCEIRFIKGRLKFSGHKHSAPFPSMIVIFKLG